MPNEADTCRRYVVPKLQAAGWEDEPHRINEQVTFTDGRIVVTGRKGRRRPGKRADYILRYHPDFPIAVAEAKASYKTPGEGMQQAKDYAEILDLKFAYATNGHGILEFDYTTGQERETDQFPAPDELWARLTAEEEIGADAAQRLLTPCYNLAGKTPRYYQHIAINRTIRAILQGNRRVLLTMATGTGKTLVAFQICWKLWSSRWNRVGLTESMFVLPCPDCMAQKEPPGGAGNQAAELQPLLVPRKQLRKHNTWFAGRHTSGELILARDAKKWPPRRGQRARRPSCNRCPPRFWQFTTDDARIKLRRLYPEFIRQTPPKTGWENRYTGLDLARCLTET